MPQEVPHVAGPAEVSVEWLDGVLHGAGLAPRGALVSIDAQTIGTGKVGEIVRFHLAYGPEATGPRSVIGKFAARDAASRRAGLMTGTYVREVGFYRTLAGSVTLRIPACYGVAFDAGSGDFVLVLEDLTRARAGDQRVGCSVDQAAAALEALAGLHAPHVGNAALDKQSWLAVRGRDSAEGLASLYDTLVVGFAERFAERLAPDVLSAAQRLRGQVGRWLARDRAPYTLVHGDYRVENMLFGEPGAGFRVAVVDWQTVAVAPPLADVAYFLGASLPVDVRREHEAELLRVYRDAMAARGVSLDLEDCWDAYRVQSFGGLHMAVVASQLVGQDPRSDEMFCVMAERHAAHAIDLDAFGLLEAADG